MRNILPNRASYFAVGDGDATAAKAGATGGKVGVPPMDAPVGRFSVLHDAQGGTLSIIQLTAPTT